MKKLDEMGYSEKIVPLYALSMYVNDFRISDRYLTSKENNCGKIENSLLRTHRKNISSKQPFLVILAETLLSRNVFIKHEHDVSEYISVHVISISSSLLVKVVG